MSVLKSIKKSFSYIFSSPNEKEINLMRYISKSKSEKAIKYIDNNPDINFEFRDTYDFLNMAILAYNNEIKNNDTSIIKKLTQKYIDNNIDFNNNIIFLLEKKDLIDIEHIIKIFIKNKVKLPDDILYKLFKFNCGHIDRFSTKEFTHNDFRILKHIIIFIIDNTEININYIKKNYPKGIFVYLLNECHHVENSDLIDLMNILIVKGGNLNIDGYNIIYEILKPIAEKFLILEEKIDILNFLLKNGANINAMIYHSKVKYTMFDILPGIFESKKNIKFLIENGYIITKDDIFNLIKNKRYDLAKKILDITDIKFSQKDFPNKEDTIIFKLFKKYIKHKSHKTHKTHKSQTEYSSTKYDDSKILNSFDIDHHFNINKILSEQIRYISSLEKSIIDNLKLYTSHASFNINQHLPSEKLKLTVENITDIKTQINDIFLRIPEISQDIVVYRGINTAEAFSQSFGLYNDSYKAKGYISTSYNAREAIKFINSDCCLLSITIPTGSQIIPLMGISRFKHESEILLPRNSEFYLNNTYYYNDSSNDIDPDKKIKVYDLMYKGTSENSFTFTFNHSNLTSLNLTPRTPVSSPIRISNKYLDTPQKPLDYGSETSNKSLFSPNILYTPQKPLDSNRSSVLFNTPKSPKSPNSPNSPKFSKLKSHKSLFSPNENMTSNRLLEKHNKLLEEYKSNIQFDSISP